MAKQTSEIPQGSKAPSEWDEVTPEVDGDEFAERPPAGQFLKRQMNLIYLIDEYREKNLIDDRKMKLSTFAEKSGISFFTIKSIMNGHRWAAKATRETIERLALILKVPVVQIYILCEFIKPEDVVFSLEGEDETLNTVYRAMVKDKRMMYRVPVQSDWDVWPRSAKISLCMMYETMRQEIFLQYATTKIIVN
jgi:hypothetical protein